MLCFICSFGFFFFNQKTAYELRISDWSSDVCSSDLAARGIRTSRGGMTSHAAVVARGMGRPCVAGAGEISIDYAAGELKVGGRVLSAGETVTIDGATGEVIDGEVPTIDPEMSGDFARLMEWADRVRRLRVRANAETPADARMAREFGAEGIGL